MFFPSFPSSAWGRFFREAPLRTRLPPARGQGREAELRKTTVPKLSTSSNGGVKWLA